ncbi:MAG TPA: C25 family cysteine peptidase [Candidatus Kapabacteria bacterium]|nr:C25 family cysteine peptidase [Candidatus Kapabacteria bacterium]
MRFPGFLLSLVLLLAAATVLHAQSVVPSAQARVSVVRSDASGVVLRISELRADLMREGAAVRLAHNASRHALQRDSLAAPSLQLTVAVPPGVAGFRTAMTDVASMAMPLEAPVMNGTARQGVGIGALRSIRGLSTITLTYDPIRISGTTVAVDTAFTIALTWSGIPTGLAKESVVESAGIDHALAALVVNYAQAKSWRGRASRATLQSGTVGWGIGEAMILLVPRDGIYRVSAAELTESATSLAGTPVALLALQHRGQSRPIHVGDVDANGRFDGADFVEFPGERNRGIDGDFFGGDSSWPDYYDAVTDTNAYVLSWDGRAGEPLRIADVALSADAPAMRAYDSTLHFEQELTYFIGMSMPEPEKGQEGGKEWGGDIRTVHVSERVPGEGFVWYDFRGSGARNESFTFNCAPALQPNGSYALRVRIANAATQATPIDLVLNDYGRAGSFMLPPRSDTTIDVTVPAHFLVNGRNTLKIFILHEGDVQYRLLLDWFELRGPWRASTTEASPRFTIPSSATTGAPMRVRLNGLPAPATHAMSARTRVVIDSGATPGLHFRMSSRTYYAGGDRANYGFSATFGDSLVASGTFFLGLVMVELDAAGTIVRRDAFRTFNDAAELTRAAAFLEGVSSGNFIVAGTSHGFGLNPIPAQLDAALTALGSTVATRQGRDYAAWAFVARKGDLSSAREEYAPMTGFESRGVTLDEWLPSDQGNRYRAVFTVAGDPGEEFVLGAEVTPAVRYHRRDELVGSDNRADLIIITHPAFRDQAERLAAHRRAHAPAGARDFAVRVVDVNDVYDEFGSGVKHQLPIRSFLQYADSNWAAPAPGYVILFGDASADPQRRTLKSKMIDYVPTFGEPASDYWYTMPFRGLADTAIERWSFDVGSSFNQFIGRIPAMTPRDGDVMVDKIIEYDTSAPAEWNKRVVFIAGGENAEEVSVNRSFAEALASDYVMYQGFQGDTTIRWRRTILGFPTTPPHEDSRWAQEAMAESGVWVNAAGHGSRTVLDLDFGMPEEIDNGSRYFVLGTFSCQTGAFSEVESSLRNEDFLKAPRRGAIATYGSTGWSYQSMNNQTVGLALAYFTYDSVRALGALTTIAKWSLFGGAEEAWWHQGYEGFRARNHLMQYTLLGDPSQDLKVSRKRELGFQNLSLANATGGALSVTDSAATVRVDLFNYGRPILAIDGDGDTAITVVGTIIGPDRTERTDTVIVERLGRSQSVTLTLPLDGKPGDYTIRIEADPLMQVDESYRADNVIVQVVPVRGNQPLTLEPVSFGRVAGYDDVVIRLLNPASGGGAELTVDTVPTFDAAPFTSATVGSMTTDDLTTTWTFSIPSELRGARRFWWRAISTTGDIEIARRFPLIETFTVEPAARAEFLMGGRLQMAGRTENLVNADDGVGPGSRRARLVAEAVGQSRYANGDLISDTKIDIYVEDGSGTKRRLSNQNRAGLQIAVLEPETLELIPDFYVNYVFFENGPMIDSAVRFIATIPAGHPVVVGTNGRSFDGLRESAALREALASLGAVFDVDSIGNDDSYVLIGGRDMPRSQAWVYGDSLARARRTGVQYAKVSTDMEFFIRPSPGVMTTPTIGPATAWRTARLGFGDAGARPVVTIVGVRRDGVRDSLASADAVGDIDLGFVDVARYPRLELRTRFAQDSTTRLRSIEVDFEPSPELAIVPRSIDLDRDSVLQGDPARLSLTVVNLSRRYGADSVGVALRHRSVGEWREIDALPVTIAPMERREVAFDLATDRFGASNAFIVQLNPTDDPAEPYRHNNTDTASMRAGFDTTRPRLAVYADGVRVMDGDFVSPMARFELRLFDNSRLRIADSTAIGMFLDLVEITLDSGAQFDPAPGGDARASFVYTPPAPGLENGEHTITYMARDASGNRTESEFVRFQVERALRIVEAVNYPNPFRERTEFTFGVAGGSQPTGGEIAIYTVAGRRIKSIPLGPADVHLGFNHIEWDGLDDDRDPLANGVYLYRLMIESADGKVEVIEKLVVMR